MSGEQIASALRLRQAGKARWQGRCPSCGYATGFAVTASGNGQPLVYCHAGGCEQVELIEAVRKVGLWPEGHMGRDAHWQRRSRPQPQSAERSEAERRDQALGLWRSALPPGLLIRRYLSNRQITTTIPGVIRYLPDASHPSGVRLPVMVALAEHAAHGPVAIHRTFLCPEGGGKPQSSL